MRYITGVQTTPGRKWRLAIDLMLMRGCKPQGGWETFVRWVPRTGAVARPFNLSTTKATMVEMVRLLSTRNTEYWKRSPSTPYGCVLRGVISSPL
jgi:hypothetical protein